MFSMTMTRPAVSTATGGFPLWLMPNMNALHGSDDRVAQNPHLGPGLAPDDDALL